MTAENHIAAARAMWDVAAASFDSEPDHGLRDPATREAWSRLLRRLLPPPPAAILDAGCGTGTLTTLLARLEHRVTGIDVSPAMLTLAREKASNLGVDAEYLLQDAASPRLPGRTFSVVLCRHVLWTLPEPAEVLRRWSNLLTPGGRMVLIEGHWHTGAGLRPQQIVDAMPSTMSNVVVESLSKAATLWGGSVTDDRFVVTATKTAMLTTTETPSPQSS